MSLWDDFKAGVSELVNAPVSFLQDSTGIVQGDYTIPPSSGLSHDSLNQYSFAGNAQPAKELPPHNSEFTSGLNLLLSDPSQFLNQLTGGDSSNIPQSELNRVVTKPVSDNLPTIPTWVKVTAIVGVGVIALLAISVTIHEAKRL